MSKFDTNSHKHHSTGYCSPRHCQRCVSTRATTVGEGKQVKEVKRKELNTKSNVVRPRTLAYIHSSQCHCFTMSKEVTSYNWYWITSNKERESNLLLSLKLILERESPKLCPIINCSTLCPLGARGLYRDLNLDPTVIVLPHVFSWTVAIRGRDGLFIECTGLSLSIHVIGWCNYEFVQGNHLLRHSKEAVEIGSRERQSR